MNSKLHKHNGEPFSLVQHKVYGDRLKAFRHLLFSLGDELYDMHRKDGKRALSAGVKLRREIDAVRCWLEEIMAKDFPKDWTTKYYYGEPVQSSYESGEFTVQKHTILGATIRDFSKFLMDLYIIVSNIYGTTHKYPKLIRKAIDKAEKQLNTIKCVLDEIITKEYGQGTENDVYFSPRGKETWCNLTERTY